MAAFARRDARRRRPPESLGSRAANTTDFPACSKSAYSASYACAVPRCMMIRAVSMRKDSVFHLLHFQLWASGKTAPFRLDRSLFSFVYAPVLLVLLVLAPFCVDFAYTELRKNF